MSIETHNGSGKPSSLLGYIDAVIFCNGEKVDTPCKERATAVLCIALEFAKGVELMPTRSKISAFLRGTAPID